MTQRKRTRKKAPAAAAETPLLGAAQPPTPERRPRAKKIVPEPEPAAGLRVHLYPKFRGEDEGDGGVRRVVEAQIRHLGDLGVGFADRPDDADVIACHIDCPDTYARFFPRTPLVAHCHGLYWAEYEWASWALKANERVVELLRIADAITAPSEWVAQTIRRHTSRRVEVVPHGVDLEEWAGGSSRGYVLWNKTRPDPVCDPGPVAAAAELLPDVPFVTTFAPERAPANVSVTGKLSYEQARDLVKAAAVYLCTTKETFGIGTLEALAAGVPVVGFDHGGQAEIVEHGVDGWLARPGDARGLAEGIRWALANREVLTQKCKEKAARFPWRAAAERYRDIYARVHARAVERARSPKVSVVVTAYDLEKYLPDCLESVLGQTLTDWECLVVDDASPDRCGEIADSFAAADPRFVPIRNRENLYLAGARNAAIERARGEYVIPLDADDMLAPGALEVLARALDGDRTIHVAYGRVRFVDEDGRTPTDYRIEGEEPGHSTWPVPFVFENQARGMNLLPYCSMYRRDVWEETGGYRRRCRTAEDADFWTRVSSYGFRPRFVTGEDTLIYRNREGSMSRSVGARRWIRWFPWGANVELAPAGAPTRQQLPIPSFDPPAVSVVIPVGPGHEEIVADAVDSVDAQSFRAWECIVVNDSGRPLARLPSWVRQLSTGPRGRRGVSAARNAGIAASRAPLFLPLDADDLLEPDALQWLLDAGAESKGAIIYSDFWEDPGAEGEWLAYQCPDYDPALLVGKGAIHPVTALTPRAAWEAVGGYDETLDCWEDWAFALAAAEKGFCSRRIAAPLFTYRKHTGGRREENVASFARCKAAMAERFGRFWDGRKDIMGCGCTKTSTITPGSVSYPASQRPPAEGAVLVRYTGAKLARINYRGPSGTVYGFAGGEPPKWVLGGDVRVFEGRRDFEVVQSAPNAAAASGPTLVAEGPPVRNPSPAREPREDHVGVMNAGAALVRDLSRSVAVLVPDSPAQIAADRSFDPSAAVDALMEMGMTREEAERKVGR